MRLTKHHGLGNDFLVVLDPVDAWVLDAPVARRLCDRRTGVGADGLLVGRTHTAEAPSSRRPVDPEGPADVAMVLFNADGSRAEISGNGIRCLVQAVARQRGLLRAALTVDTDAGRRSCDLAPTEDPVTVVVSVDMGAVGAGPTLPAEVATRAGVAAVASAAIGNPHAVVLAGEGGGPDLAALGSWLDDAVEGGINVEVISPGDRPDTIDLGVFERGVGITQACGSGACAAAAVARGWGLVGDVVTVRMPGGEAVVRLAATDDEGAGVTLVGPATWVADVEVPDPA